METTTLITQAIFCTAAFLLLHTSVLYPCLAFLLSGSRKRSPTGVLPKVSVLVPAHNEASVIAAKISNFKALDYPRDSIELIIADDGSEDATAEIVRQHTCEGLRLLCIEPRSGKANAMNELVSAANYPVLLFTDANVMLRPDAVTALVGYFGDDRVGAVTGEVRLHGSDRDFAMGESLYYLLEHRIQQAETRFGSVIGVDGGMYAMRRELYQQIPVDTILDDFLVSMMVLRARRRIVYTGSAQSSESGTPTVKQEFARRVRISAGAIQLLKRGQVPRLDQVELWFQFFSHKLLRWFTPLLLSILLVSNLALMGAGSLFQFTFACQLFLYGAVLVTGLVPSLRTSRVGGVFFYAGLSQIAMVIGIQKGLFNRQPPQWEKGQRLEETL